MSRNKWLILVLLVGVALLSVASALAQENSVAFNSYSSDPVPRAFEEGMVAAWNEANPDTPVQHSIINHEDFKQAIRAYLLAEPAPDVLTWFAGNRARFFIDRGLIMDLSDMWEAEGYGESYAPGFNALATVGEGKYFLPTSYYCGRSTTVRPCSKRLASKPPRRPLTNCWKPATS
jgi:multiple sugar transport system substrate-binding protein/raffinose/stachyose/melibiose transport system substrate-binding protein